ncbi:MAG: hypothetical protein PHP31_03225 [Lentimicrobiaceae bacterium]|nr:hypothetical protein [Lentimicrobiaceae bacterium]
MQTVKFNQIKDSTLTDKIVLIEFDTLHEKELMPGILLFDIPKNYIPTSLTIKTNQVLSDFKIEDGEQTVIFSADNVNVGSTIIEAHADKFDSSMPTLNVSYFCKDELVEVDITVECSRI